ncbi:hypothetical protein GUJ93_ZPchr0001g29932 [Zizania palustris]|uniref:SIAH-type domain-containing protein n=1 Tax=Zizania palustris TaxID=103762 RepID=A0A8J5RNX1_ZIZPA|nr:hypothetical protein GUJ93_ZPchr0001g29932 [Zizania palustris]
MMDGHGAPKKARTGKQVSDSDEVEEAGEEETTKVTYSMDRDVLECCICLTPFEAQIYMCKNGHAACGKCCLGLKRACAYCSESIGDIRCRPLEALLASMSSPCYFRGNGCMQTVAYCDKRSHEESCPYAPCHCPFEGCSYLGLLLHRHVLDEHAKSKSAAVTTTGSGSARSATARVTLDRREPFRVILQRGGSRVFVLHNGGDVLSGRSLSLVSVGPPPPANSKLKYKIAVTSDERSEFALSASGDVPCVRQLDLFEAKSFLFVPDDFWGSSSSVCVSVSIQL